MKARLAALLAWGICSLVVVIWLLGVAAQRDLRCGLIGDGRSHCWNGVYDATWPPEVFQGRPAATA